MPVWRLYRRLGFSKEGLVEKLHITPVEKEKLCSLFLSREPLLTLQLYRKQTGSRMNRILVVDDDPHIREVVQFALDKEGFGTIEARNGVEALERFEAEQPDLMVLDITMPELDGTEVCRRIRQTSKKPIIFLSSRDDEIDRVLGLELGGDDYITKPFSPRELVARVKAVLRRLDDSQAMREQEGTAIMQHGRLSLNLDDFTGQWEETQVVLTLTEFGILRTLMQRPGKVYSRDDLMSNAYELSRIVSDRTIDSHVRRVRKKFADIGADPVETVHGIGYKLGAC